jgi:coproporphyrinogen III oxidase-like Fe-S oxidoreductase
MISDREITVWTISALIAIGIGWSKFAKYRTREKMVRDFAAMDPERREKLLSRLQPELQMEIRQELMKRFRLKTEI